ncbi:hypothetical protein Cgig2_011861 [Carnegiea gigantea]|uniref:Retrotransposon gag domain-containing protein n=1 Tax=Carnegiea gigantea TaxID=171969 RepID=A0A9Q1K980_9CARY|nr:hypothetical protein Cgig2_011861 [Carnegiea gigantea]
MSTMTDAIMQQVSEQMKKAVEVASSVRPFLHFEYVPTEGCEPSCRHDHTASPHHGERVQEAPRVGEDWRSWEEHRGHSIGANAYPHPRSSHGRPAKLTTASMPCATRSRRTAWPLTLKEGSPNSGRPLSAVQTGSSHAEEDARMTSVPKPQNAQKYCEFHEQNGHMITECRELRKALHELADKGQIDRFLKRGPRSSCGGPSRSLPRNKEVVLQPPPWCLEGNNDDVSHPHIITH